MNTKAGGNGDDDSNFEKIECDINKSIDNGTLIKSLNPVNWFKCFIHCN